VKEIVFLDACQKSMEANRGYYKAGKMIASIGRLKPPASTVAPAFFQRSVKPDLLPA